MLDDYVQVLEVRKQRPQDQGLPKTSAGSPARSASPAAVAAAAPATGRPGRPRAPARVFALAREDAEQAEHVTEGTVLLLGVHTRVLFDTGATHSFIFERFSRQLALESGVESEDLEVPLSVHTPAGMVSTRKCILSLPACIEDRILEGSSACVRFGAEAQFGVSSPD